MRHITQMFIALLLTVAAALADPLPPLTPITNDQNNYRLSRNPTRSLAVDAQGVLHAVYWWGGEYSAPDLPGGVAYRSWTPEVGWLPPIQVDDAYVTSGPQAGQRIGGRHPSLALADDGTVWVAWHDHRHCTASPGAWIDNVEIYADRKPPGGAFDEQDLRLTTTNEDHLGDSGYNPRLTVGPDGRVHVVWYDFHFDGHLADIFLQSSDPTGVFPPTPTMADMRLTNLSQRGNWPSYVQPDIAAMPDGGLHLVWTDRYGLEGDLYHARVSPLGVMSQPVVLRTYASSYFDPPRIHVAPDGNPWLAWTDTHIDEAQPRIHIMRHDGTAFEPSQQVTQGAIRQYHPSLVVDADGLAHLAWIDERAGRHVYYGRYDPVAQAMLVEQRVSLTSGAWARPCLALDALGAVYLMVERGDNQPQGDIHFATTRVSLPTSAPAWRLYR